MSRRSKTILALLTVLAVLLLVLGAFSIEIVQINMDDDGIHSKTIKLPVP